MVRLVGDGCGDGSPKLLKGSDIGLRSRLYRNTAYALVIRNSSVFTITVAVENAAIEFLNGLAY